MKPLYMVILPLIMVVGCKRHIEFVSFPDPKPTTKVVDHIDNQFDDAVIRSRVTLNVTADSKNTAMNSIKNLLGLTTAYAASSTITVTYTNTPNVTFTLNTGSFGPTSVDSSNNLGMGSITVSALSDNKLKVCGTGGNTKCTTAFIRAYTTGEKTVGSGHNIDGFIHIADEYGAPVYSDKNATPTTLVGTGSSNAAVLQTYTIPNNVNKVNLSHFPTPYYSLRYQHY